MKLFYSLTTVLLLCTALNYSAYSQDTTTTITVKVKGITCHNDLGMIQKSIEKLAGVANCEVGKQGATTKFVVVYDPEQVNEKAIYEAIEGTGSCENPNERPYKVKV